MSHPPSHSLAFFSAEFAWDGFILKDELVKQPTNPNPNQPLRLARMLLLDSLRVQRVGGKIPNAQTKVGYL